jgi:protein involved in polysaccharide export with SLBB domain
VKIEIATMKSIALSSLCATALSALLVNGASAQTGASELRREFESRAELEARAKAAEANHRTAEAWLLKTRLEKGDFQEGDRIVITMPNGIGSAGPSSDTIVVREGRILQLPRLGDFKLEGVLRSELNAKLREHIAKFVIEPTVRATPLLRVSVFGEVRNPGFFYGPADVLLSDVIMRAGGPTPNADWDKVVIKRGKDVMWTEQDVRTSLIDGLSLDRLSLRSGDEVVIGRTRNVSWMTALQIVSSLFLVAATVISVAR